MTTHLRAVCRALCVVLLLSCHRPKTTAPQPTAVRVQGVDEATLAGAMRYSAQILPSKRVDVAFKVGGYVAAIAQTKGLDGSARILQEGDAVAAGQHLISLRQTDYHLRVDELAAARAQAKAVAAQAQVDYERASELAGRGSIAQAALESARLSRDSGNAALAMTDARFEQSRTALQDASLRSPIDGVIVARLVEIGSLVAPGTVAFSVATVSTVKAVFGVPDTMLARVQLGDELAIVTEAYPGQEFRGQITRVAPTADANGRVFEVEITLPNPALRLKAGMVAALSLSETASARHRVVPLSAIVRSPHDAKKFAVFVVDKTAGKTVARARDVALGEYLGNVIPVASGLSGSEHVVVQGAGLLSDGEVVEIIP